MLAPASSSAGEARPKSPPPPELILPTSPPPKRLQRGKHPGSQRTIARARGGSGPERAARRGSAHDTQSEGATRSRRAASICRVGARLSDSRLRGSSPRGVVFSPCSASPGRGRGLSFFANAISSAWSRISSRWFSGHSMPSTSANRLNFSVSSFPALKRKLAPHLLTPAPPAPASSPPSGRTCG